MCPVGSVFMVTRVLRSVPLSGDDSAAGGDSSRPADPRAVGSLGHASWTASVVWRTRRVTRAARADGCSPKRPQHWRGGVNLWTLLIGSNHAVAAPPGAMMRVRPFSRYAIP